MDTDELKEMLSIAEKDKYKKLYLSNKDIMNLPPEIGKLTSLTYLDLSYNQLKKLPAEISKLVNLKSLLLHRNELEELPVQIGKLANLNLLDLSHNKLSTIPEEIGNLSKLKVFDLSYNNMLRLPGEFINLISLKELYLEKNNFEFPPSKVIKRGLYATMHYLTGEMKKREAQKVIIQIFNMPAEIQSPFRQYIDCFNDLVTNANQQAIRYELKFIKNDQTQEVEIQKDVEGYLSDFVSFVKQNIDTIKDDFSDKLEASMIDMQIMEVRNQISSLNESFDRKLEEIKIIQTRLNSFYRQLDKKITRQTRKKLT